MVTAGQLRENSRQGFDVQKQTRIGIESGISRNLRWGCGHIYDETPVDIAVYVRNDPVNLVDPDGRLAVGFIDHGDTPIQLGIEFFFQLHKSSSRDLVDPWLRQFDQRVRRAKEQAQKKLNHAGDDCLKLLGRIGVTVETLDVLMDSTSYTNGAVSSEKYWAAMGRAVGDGSTTADTTIEDIFQMGKPPWPSETKVMALSSYTNSTVYFRTSAITWDNLIHELVHQVSGESFFGDQQILERLADLYGKDPNKGGIDVNGFSGQISDKIKEKCN